MLPKPPSRSLAGEIASVVGGYVVGQFKVAAILALLYMVGFALARVPLWPLMGLLGGLFQLVPVIGSLLTVAAVGLVLLFGGADLNQYLMALGVFVVVQGLEGFYLTPKIVGRRTGLSGITVFFAILIGGALFGPPGLLLAVPAAAVVAVLWRRLRTHPVQGR